MAERGGRGRSAPHAPTRTCFIGNLPWDITEPQLRELFAEVGPIKNFRVVTDRETGKPKGFGFCEYFDVATAASAQRNLNSQEVNGRRIHVDFAEDKERPDVARRPGGAPPRQPQQPQVVGMDSAQRAAGSMATLVDGQPPQVAGPPDSITTTLAGMSRKQLYEVMAQMKALIQQNPQQARQIMVQNPQLTKALFQAQIMLGMVPTPPGADAPPHANGGPPMQHEYQPEPYQQAPPEQGSQYNAPQQLYGSQPMGPTAGGYDRPGPDYGQQGGGGFGGQPPQQFGGPQGPADPRAAMMGEPQPQMGGYGSDPRQQAGLGGPASDLRAQHFQGAPYSPAQQQQEPPQQPQVPAAALPAAGQQLDPEQQKALLAQVMNLTPAQIDLLPPQQKAQVIALQQQMRQQAGGF